MSEQYFLRPDNSIVSYEVKVSIRGNASTVPRLRRKGGGLKNLPSSKPNANGSIKKTELGEAGTLINSVLVFDTLVLLDGISDLDEAFEELRILYKLDGGIDGPQLYELTSKEKLQLNNKKAIVASKAIKLVSQ